MNHKARATIEEFSMLRQGDTVTAAVSGGADSVALLDFLCALSDLALKVRACHLNHCLRGAESDRDERLVRTMCEQYGVPLDVKRVEIKPLARAAGQSLELAARGARYAFFEELAARHGGRVATAHTLSDSAETVLLNLARGTGLAGLCGIPPVRGVVIRPLIACTRAEIETYCAAHDIAYVTDSSNLSDDYTRNHIRHNVLPQLCRVNPEALGAVGRMTASLTRDADYLAEEAARAGAAAERGSGFDAGALNGLHPAIRARVIGARLAALGVERDAERTALIEGMLETGRPRVLQVGRGDYVSVRDGVLRFEHRSKPARAPLEPAARRKITLDGACVPLGDGREVLFSVISRTDYEIFENNTDLVLKNAVDYDKINDDIFIRARQTGDRIRQTGRGCTKTLKKLYSELALEARDRLCVIADSGGVVFAEGAGVDERVAVCPSTRNVLAFRITGQKMEDNRQ